MCGICGFINFKTNLVKNERENLAVAHRMAEKTASQRSGLLGRMGWANTQCLLIAVWRL